MRFRQRQLISPALLPVVPGGRVEVLPPDLAFLERFGVERETLREAAARAGLEGTDGRRALLAEGAVSEAFYYHALAWHLGLPFSGAWPHPTDTPLPSAAAMRGPLRLAGHDPPWLIAPATQEIQVLLAAQARGVSLPDVAITAPAHLAAIVCHRAAARIADRASRALPEVAPHLSAFEAVPAVMVALLCLGLFGLLGGVACGSHVESNILGLVFLSALGFRLAVFAEGLPPLARRKETPLPDRSLPTYTVMVPLRDEADSVAELVANLAALDYPRAKREVLFLVEPDDPSTRAALAAQQLPPGFRILDLPPGKPHTKPRALNVGLLVASGDLVTVYDAEDRPEPDQLRRAAARFAKAPDSLACLQARLAICNGKHSLLSRLFAIEYAGLFDVFNVGLGRLGLPIGLGGTSNHFRASVLRAVGGWDAWNVTEDADLGLRLARFGYDIDMLDSTTFEEAPERLGLWFKQRRRWTKGWMQTLVVLTRDLPGAMRDFGPHRALAAALLLTNLVTGPLLTPFFLALVLWRLAIEGLPSPHGGAAIVETTLAYAVLIIGAIGTLWQGWVGGRARRLFNWQAFLAYLPYQLMISAAACFGLYDLVRRPHHWHKTPHGAAARRVRRPASAASPPA